MFLGISLPLVYGFVIRRIRCRDDIERDFGIPVIAEFGAIPV
jgi:polysaccharide biosynthesis transport protein